jgi:predicted RNase H-like HicB family nuclease
LPAPKVNSHFSAANIQDKQARLKRYWQIPGNQLNYREGENMLFTAIFQKVPEGYIGFVEELPGANTQGDTLEEARQNLKEAAQLVLEANRQLAEEELAGHDVIREEFSITL